MYYRGYLTQVYFLKNFVGTEHLFLTAKTSYWFVAICQPLNYTVTINPCFHVLFHVSWFTTLWFSLVHILLMTQLIFSIGTEMPHFFCEMAQLLKVPSPEAERDGCGHSDPSPASVNVIR